jgi:hypothetical protein
MKKRPPVNVLIASAMFVYLYLDLTLNRGITSTTVYVTLKNRLIHLLVFFFIKERLAWYLIGFQIGFKL